MTRHDGATQSGGDEAVRTRTYSWGDPMIGAAAAPTMSGLDYLRTIMRGEVPPAPISRVLDFTLDTVEEGRVVFMLEPAEYHYNPIGMVHGGVACTLFDSAMGCAVHTMLPAGVGYTTLELKVNFLRPLSLKTGRVWCEGKTIHVGRTTALAEAWLRDTGGKLYGHATTTCMIFREPTPSVPDQPSS